MKDIIWIMKILRAGLLTAGIFITMTAIYAQEKNPGQPMPLFQSDDIINLKMAADFKTVFSVQDDSTYFPATLTLTDNNGEVRVIDIEIRTRGNTRRKKEVCRFAPLRVKFPKHGTDGTPFEGQRAIKLVTHCDKPDYGEQNAIVEYLIYRTYNILTDTSFKVRPALIDYIFLDKKEDSIRRFAFFIERTKYLEERLNQVEIKTDRVHPDRMNPFQTCLVDMFEYMIGNTDYSIYEPHNIDILANEGGYTDYLPVPFDFDWSGLISARYAVPNPMLGTETVKERVYRGLKKEPEIVYRTIGLFNAKKPEIYSLFENYALLEDNEKKSALKYLDKFYEIINDERDVQREFFENAREVKH